MISTIPLYLMSLSQFQNLMMSWFQIRYDITHFLLLHLKLYCCLVFFLNCTLRMQCDWLLFFVIFVIVNYYVSNYKNTRPHKKKGDWVQINIFWLSTVQGRFFFMINFYNQFLSPASACYICRTYWLKLGLKDGEFSSLASACFVLGINWLNLGKRVGIIQWLVIRTTVCLVVGILSIIR